MRAKYHEKIGCEEISSRKTGEKLSIVCFANYNIEHILEIKRSKAEEKKGDKTEANNSEMKQLIVDIY